MQRKETAHTATAYRNFKTYKIVLETSKQNPAVISD